MVITFKELRFKNILSFGNSETIIEFSKGINLISGINGAGKSAILDALSFCLFGKPYRNIKIKELINRRNKKNTEVVCTFTTDSGKNSFEIKRTLNPDSLEILKDGSETDLLSSKKLNQEELNKIIGIDYRLFKQVISLAVNYNKPFLSLSSMEKREIIEQIFNITVFGQMFKEAKRKNADNIVRHELNNNSIKILQSNLVTLRKNLGDITSANNDFEKNKENEIKDINERIFKYETDIQIIDEKIEENNKEISLFSIESVNMSIKEAKTKLEKLTKSITTKEHDIEINQKNINHIEVDVICPRCNTTLTPEHKEKEIQRLNNENSLLQCEREEKESEKKKIQEQFELLESSVKNYENILNINKSNLERKILIETELLHTKDNRLKIIDRKIDIDIESINLAFNTKIEEYKKVFKNSSTIKNIISNYESVFSILSETGIKAFFFRKLIPILNTKINEYLQLFEIQIVCIKVFT